VKPDIEEPGGIPVGSHRPRVRLFVALHLAAVGTIYAVALVVGGGLAGPPMPPLAVAMAKAQPAPEVQSPLVVMPAALPVAPSPTPEWTRRPEIAAPWETR
jgi:hypothetical protein